MPELEHKQFVDAAGGYSFSLAVTEEGEVWSWGFNDKVRPMAEE
jgi:alpha-tubulin suppressor-like RCC1 family protein